jgi:hypothetical protein
MAQFGEREVIGVDVHPGIGVDRIGDAHRLSALFSRDSVAVTYSESVLEHVAKPWLVALQCNRVLMIGGIAIHVAPWLWPTHASPNDFWRFSASGLKQLFGRELGFEILETGSFGSATVTPHPTWLADHVRMPTMHSDAVSWIVARKIAQPDSDINWPYDEAEGIAEARRYPLDGLRWNTSTAGQGR